MPPTLALDSGATLSLVETAAGLELRAGSESGDLTPRTVHRLLAHLRVLAPDGTEHRADAHGRFRQPGALHLGGTTLARWRPGSLERVTRLCPFELRTLAETGFPHPRAVTGDDAPLRTDLHAHFAGCPRPETLREVALALDLTVDGALLAEAGVRGLSGPVPLRSLPPPALARWTAALHLPLDRQSTFRDMERAYRLRGPVTKALAAFPALLDAVAADYAAAGVHRVELSLGDATRRAWLEAAVAGAERAWRRHGLELRFLTAISRHDDPEWDEDLLARVEALGAVRELVGVDWMGHETNSTRAFADRLTRVARWAHRHRPGFVVRVHAGENPAFPENVRVAAEAVRGLDVTLRIGHALYGSDEALALLREARALVELNLTSNHALNNLHSTADAPLHRLLDAGVACVLGTDGPGLYGTTPVDELRVARLAGLTDAQLQRLREAEQQYLARARAVEARLPAAAPVPEDAPLRHFTPEVAAEKRRATLERRRRLLGRLEALGVPCLTAEEVAPRLREGPVVCIAGAWRDAWAAASAGSRARIAAVLAGLVEGLPEGAVLVTGGTVHGVEGEVHRLAAARPGALRVLAAVVEATTPEDLDGRVTHATLLAPTPHEKAPALYEAMRECDALCLFFGGGNVVHDELRAAANLRLRYLALSGVDGASGRHAAQVPHRAFHAAADALRRLGDRAFFRQAFAPFWHPGVNPTVDVIVRRGDQVLLIRRHDDAAAEPGQWALPGGFVHTRAPRGEPFRCDAEAPLDAALREVREETGLDLSALRARFVRLAEVEGGGRDERDTPMAWSRTTLFQVTLDDAHAALPVHGGDDAQDARWFPRGALPPRLAFDHAALLRYMPAPMNPQIFREYDVRGLVDTDLTDAVVKDLGRGLATMVKRAGGTTVVVGRDARLSGPRFREAFVAGVTSTGVHVVDVGVVPTPIVYFAANTLPVDGLAMITGSHNPPEYNGFKMGVGKTTFYGETIQELRRLIERGDFEQSDRPGTVSTFDAVTPYLHFVTSTVKRGPKRLKVVVDAGNGVGGLVAVPLLERLGYEVVPLYCEPDGRFPNHHADPTVAKNLELCIARVRETKADLGIAFDGDADRIGVVDGHGDILWGDKLMVLLARAVLEEVPGAAIVGEVKCSFTMYDDIAKHGGRPIMWKAGHSLIKAKMKETHAALAGEMSGHIFYKHRFFGFDDAPYTAARLLEILSHRTQTLAELLADVPVTYSSPELRFDTVEEKKFALVQRCTEKLRARGLALVEVDGVRATWPDGWGLIRASNTTPILVVRYEATTRARLAEIQALIDGTIHEAKAELGG